MKRHFYHSHIGSPNQGKEQEDGYGFPAKLGSVHDSFPVLDNMKDIQVETRYEEDKRLSRFPFQRLKLDPLHKPLLFFIMLQDNGGMA
jgi:hypothetical protein